jgi:hypothetical protein
MVAGAVSAGGRPRGRKGGGLRKSDPSAPRSPPEEPRELRLDLVGLAFRLLVVRPAGLPRLPDPRR